VTGEDATQLPDGPAVARYPNCPGKAYMQALERDFAGTMPDQEQDFIAQLGFGSEITIEASPSVATHIASVDGRPHVFFVNFKGLIGGKNPVQTPETDARLAVSGQATARFLPFLGDVQTLRGESKNGKTTFLIPPITKGAVVWLHSQFP
jgi:hypothetical protein